MGRAMKHEVFISYARSTSSDFAEALHGALGGKGCVSFLDSSDIDAGERIPLQVLEALLEARAVVIFADEAYFTRWYCLREFDISLSPYRALLRRGGTEAELNQSLRRFGVWTS